MHKRTPSYCLHKATGQAVVRIDGKDHYLGKFDSPESRTRYDQLIGEWYANARTLPPVRREEGLTVAELLLRYWRWAEEYYRDEDGNPSRELENLRDALKPLKRLYSQTAAADFGPLALRALQDELIRAGLSRNVINYRVNRIRRVFKWAVSFDLVPAAIHQALQAVPGLRRGRCKARETEKVKPVSVEHVQAALPFMPDPVAAMVRVQLLTACRAGEVMIMRAADLTTTGDIWTYRPHKHKNKHRGLERVIYLGSQAQAVIKPFLKTDLHAYLFSPREYVESLHARRAALRKTRRTPSEVKKSRKRQPRRAPGIRYNRRSYRLAVIRAVDKANARRAKEGLPPVPRWSPLQLRHTAATLIRAKYGVEAAKTVLGHTKVETTEIYAEQDAAKARRIIAEIG
jgi:integrase